MPLLVHKQGKQNTAVFRMPLIFLPLEQRSIRRYHQKPSQRLVARKTSLS